MTRLRIALAAAALAVPAVAVPAAPAEASFGVCSGTGHINVPLMMLPIIGVPNAGPINGHFEPCVHGADVVAFLSGYIAGNCGWASGAMSAAGHSGTFSVAGTTMVLTGGLVGTLEIVPSGSCLTGTSGFDLSGSFALV
jgi:hypothetical protein